MEFNEKLQELRKREGLTQEQLAARLFVSRTAISKWESGRGYPNLDSLKAISSLFSVSVDSLISTNEALDVAEADKKDRSARFRDLALGLLDVCMLLLLILPFFGEVADGAVQGASLLALSARPYLKALYYAAVIGTTLAGLMTLALQRIENPAWLKAKSPLSLALGTFSVLVFIISSQVYAAAFAFVLLFIKAMIVIRSVSSV